MTLILKNECNSLYRFIGNATHACIHKKVTLLDGLLIGL